MIGVPMPDPRDSIIDNLNKQMADFFGAGNVAQEIAQGVSDVKDGTYGGGHSSKLRAERDRIAPRLKELVDSGLSLHQSCLGVGIDHKRARLIARENGFKLPDSR